MRTEYIAADRQMASAFVIRGRRIATHQRQLRRTLPQWVPMDSKIQGAYYIFFVDRVRGQECPRRTLLLHNRLALLGWRAEAAVPTLAFQPSIALRNAALASRRVESSMGNGDCS